MRFLLIKGNVVGGHQIEDLGLTVPYQKTKRVHSDRASWSSDLAKSISRGQVIKVGFEEPRRRPQIYQNHPESSRSKKQKDTNNPLLESNVQAEDTSENSATELENQAVASEETADESVSNNAEDGGKSEQLESMKQMNQQLMEKMDRLMAMMISSQNNDKDDEGGSSVDMEKLAQLITHQSSGAQTTPEMDDEDDEGDMMYIPSQIRSTNAKANVDVDEGESSGSSLDDAAKALSSLKKSSSSSS